MLQIKHLTKSAILWQHLPKGVQFYFERKDNGSAVTDDDR